MKIQCDVCNKDGASVYCPADEAALCASCDYGVHHANKLASSHYRFNLLTPSAKDTPNCDICQDKRAFLFCKQDRAILCSDCDASIHAANQLTQRHHRFLLTGVKLSAKTNLYAAAGSDPIPDFESHPSAAKKNLAASQPAAHKTCSCCDQLMGDPCSTSSISEYLMETLPGWRVDDLLDSSSAPYAFSKQYDDGLLLPFMDADVLGHSDLMGSLFPESWASQVPSISPPFPQVPHYPSSYAPVACKETTSMKATDSRKSLIDDGFTVPQMISPHSSVGTKRSRLV
uniref:B box-type domain-containing protein n=1 Tax=Kalanchoe fedtschenkoi TaxID=63787 RepID=A0A7N0T046_KALFE